MKKFLVLVAAAFFLTSCNLPISINVNTQPTAVPTDAVTPVEIIVTATPAAETPSGGLPTVQLPTATSSLAGQEMNLGGVALNLPACLASGANGVIIAESNPGPDSPNFLYTPEYREITLTGYPLSDKVFKPMVQVYPVARFVELVPALTDQVAQMKQVLVDKPATFKTNIPVLPIMNAAQIFRSHVDYLNFQNGQGIGFLTEYAQYSASVNNHDLFYTYQGLTADGKYWVSILFPVNASYLQPSPDNPAVPADGIPAPDMNSPTYVNDMEVYYAAILQKLEATPGDAFTPTLPCIAAFVQSLNIGD